MSVQAHEKSCHLSAALRFRAPGANDLGRYLASNREDSNVGSLRWRRAHGKPFSARDCPAAAARRAVALYSPRNSSPQNAPGYLIRSGRAMAGPILTPDFQDRPRCLLVQAPAPLDSISPRIAGSPHVPAAHRNLHPIQQLRRACFARRRARLNSLQQFHASGYRGAGRLNWQR